ncbi:MAG: CBS domain-containing protein [Desulfitobacterium hafniense]|nr:CBS domain-containing protein [Desulfitobacterium hafniense]
MAKGKPSEEIYLSQLLKKPIYDVQGRVIGQLKDMAVQWGSNYPRVTGVKHASGLHKVIDIYQIDHWDVRGLKLKGKLEESNLRRIQNNEIYIGKWLLDRQIINLKNSNLVRVNDIKFSRITQGENSDIILVAIDIGLRGLFRRIGMEFLVKNHENDFVGWEHLQLSQDQQLFNRLHPSDIANIIKDLDRQERNNFIDILDNHMAADALAGVDLETQVEIIEQMDSNRASDILEEMPPDEAADILGELNNEKTGELLNLMEPNEAQDVRELMAYPEGTAGALMTTEYIAFTAEITAEDTVNQLRKLASLAETINYLYVLDEQEVLQGVLSIRDLIIAEPQDILGEIMDTQVIRVKHYDKHCKVLDIVNKYKLLAVPVVDDNNILLGIVTVDDVLENLVLRRLNTLS